MSLPHRSVRPGPDLARERGAALVVALVLVFVSSLLGLSAMETSGVETRLVVNESLRQSTFVAADGVAERAWRLVDAGTLTDDGALQSLVARSVDPRVDVDAEARLESIENAFGFSTQLFVERRYRVSATAEVPGAGAIRTIHVGASRLAPAAGAAKR